MKKNTRALRSWNGVLHGLMAAGVVALAASVAEAGAFNIELNQGGTLYGDPPVDQANVPASNGPGGDNSCAPTANANSLAYLTNAFPGVYGTQLLQDKPSATGAANPQANTTAGWTAIATELASADYMNTDETNGTSVANWINKTMSYINNNAPNTTVYEQANNPSADFLLTQLQNKEDLEIAIFPTAAGIGHVLTVTSMMGMTNGAGMVTSASIDGIDPGDPTHPFTYTLGNLSGPGAMTLTYGGNGYTVGVGFAESPVPEPSTLVLLGIAVTALCGRSAWRRRRQAA